VYLVEAERARRYDFYRILDKVQRYDRVRQTRRDLWQRRWGVETFPPVLLLMLDPGQHVARLREQAQGNQVRFLTPRREREIAPHPSLKPQRLMRQLVWAALPLGEGIVHDPFMGAGATIAAVVALGHQTLWVEVDPGYFGMAQSAIPKLAALTPDGELALVANCQG
jgi:DNA modification methylase